MAFAVVLVIVMEAYAGVGLLFAAVFLAKGLSHIDREAEHATLGFRLIIAPGVAALWPFLLSRWLRGTDEPPIERNAHRDQVHIA